MLHEDSPLKRISAYSFHHFGIRLTGRSPLGITVRRRMVGRVKYLEDGDFLASHPAEIVETELFAPLGQVATSDELLGDILQLVHIVQRHRPCVANCKRPLFDNTPEWAPKAEEIVQSVSQEQGDYISYLIICTLYFAVISSTSSSEKWRISRSKAPVELWSFFHVSAGLVVWKVTYTHLCAQPGLGVSSSFGPCRYL